MFRKYILHYLSQIVIISSKIIRFHFLTSDFEHFRRIIQKCYHFGYFPSRKWNNLPNIWHFQRRTCLISANIYIISEIFYEASTSILSKFLWHFLCHVFVFTFLSVIYQHHHHEVNHQECGHHKIVQYGQGQVIWRTVSLSNNLKGFHNIISPVYLLMEEPHISLHFCQIPIGKMLY